LQYRLGFEDGEGFESGLGCLFACSEVKRDSCLDEELRANKVETRKDKGERKLVHYFLTDACFSQAKSNQDDYSGSTSSANAYSDADVDSYLTTCCVYLLSNVGSVYARVIKTS
jgi:hypothetical protein